LSVAPDTPSLDGSREPLTGPAKLGGAEGDLMTSSNGRIPTVGRYWVSGVPERTGWTMFQQLLYMLIK
jgi:hypothetical protein